MLIRELEVDVETSSWPRGTSPLPELVPIAPSETIDLKKALVMLGTLTMPSLMSPASPARFWAWLRYAFAIASSRNLRITMDFADLDPHQKGVLSDDLGVAISTQWLYDRLGGFANIVDGRRFLLRFSHLLRRPKRTKAKIGPGKAPDFVVQDLKGKWHVLECKGTQSGRSARDTFLKTAVQQKNVVQIRGRHRGERLAAGVAISNESNRKPTHLKIVDPADGTEGEVNLDDSVAPEMEETAQRVAIGRALAIVGLSEAAMDVWLPDEVADAQDYLRPSEALRLRQSARDRTEKTRRQAKERNLEHFQRDHHAYEGRSFSFALPQLGATSDVAEVSAKVGVLKELLDSVEGSPDGQRDIGELVGPFARHARITLNSSEDQAVLRYGDLFYAELRVTGA